MAFLQRKREPKTEGTGLVLFQEVQQAMHAEKVLKAASHAVRLVAPPPELRKGCDLAVEVNLTEQPAIERLLRERDVAYISVEPLRIGTAPLLDVVKVTDFGQWVMVRAGNMKITYDKGSGIIVNVSGGGCPDIPYLYAQLVDRPLGDALRPTEIGFTLCALNLERALTECLALHTRGKNS